MSANITVTIRRSSVGEVGGASAGAGAPQLGQNRAATGSGREHEVHVLPDSGVAHDMQKRAPAGFAVPQDGQIASTLGV
jgi:hypothetical protein